LTATEIKWLLLLFFGHWYFIPRASGALLLLPKNEKCKTGLNGVVKGSHDLLMKFWDHLHISEWLKLETSNWMHIEHERPYDKNTKKVLEKN